MDLILALAYITLALNPKLFKKTSMLSADSHSAQLQQNIF